jgi:Lrp/AsnC family transcriptional regulator, leucine-responsive regulatory protein
MKNSLDAKDLLLIDLLLSNARQPLLALARGIGLSRSATQERLQRLERSGVIRGYAAQVAWPQDMSVEAWLMIKLDPGAGCHAVVPSILALPGVRLCHALAGEVDGLVRVVAGSAGEMSDIRDRLSVLPGVRSITTHFVLMAHR